MDRIADDAPPAARMLLGYQRAGRAWAEANSLPALTLTTFRDVPWNAPYYSRLGFHLLADDAIGPELAGVREHEAEIGLDEWPRVAMRRPVRALGSEASRGARGGPEHTAG